MKNRKNILTYIVAVLATLVTSASSSLGVPPLQHPLLLGLAPVAALSNSDEPASVTWTFTGSLNIARYFHTATLLPNGMVLVAGGDDSSGQRSEERRVGQECSARWETADLKT